MAELFGAFLCYSCPLLSSMDEYLDNGFTCVLHYLYFKEMCIYLPYVAFSL